MNASMKALCLSVALAVPATAVLAEETPRHERRENFAQQHPRRAEVNRRVEHQRRELNQQLKSGKITKEQYDAEMAKLKDVKAEEKADVKANGGHLTKDEQKDLNKDLNATHQDIKSNQGAAPAAPAAPQGN